MVFIWITITFFNYLQLIYGLQCKQISIVACQGLGYNMTALPNLASHINEIDAEIQVTTLLPLIESGCSKHVRFLICASLFPLCSPDVPRPVTACKSLCELVKKDCVTESFLQHLWPSFLNCETLPQPEKQELCMQIPQDENSSLTKTSTLLSSAAIARVLQKNIDTNTDVKDSLSSTSPAWPWLSWQYIHQQNHHQYLKTSSKIICPTNYTADGNECIPQCDTDAMFTAQQKKIAEAIILTLSVLCFLLTLFSLVTFWAEPIRFGYPERPILYLGLCYNLLSVCYLERIIFHHPAKESVNEENNICMLSPSCLASYVTSSYLSLCAVSWWLIFSLSFYLSSKRKWSSEALEKKSTLFHLLTWILPLAPPICAILWGAVKPYELNGMCTAIGFIEIPAIILLIAGIILIEFTSKSLQQLQKQMTMRCTSLFQSSDNNIRLLQIRKRLLVFSYLFFVPALLAMILSLFEKFETHIPPCTSLEECEHPEKFSSMMPLAKLFFHLVGGSLTGIWVWSRKTCESYKSRIIVNTATTSTTSAMLNKRKPLPPLPKRIAYNNKNQIALPLFHNLPLCNNNFEHSRV